ncbi:MAG: hypothetical protein GX868_05950 [Actinobacteria bacterium]|nr:hypothetical protein [Actinomycetota bacterium]
MSFDEIPDPRLDALSGELAMMRDIAERLVEAIVAAVPQWVLAAVAARTSELDADTQAAANRRAVDIGAAAAGEARTELAALLALPVDEQRSTPLAIVRALVRYPNEVLGEAGAALVRRDPFEERANPEDRYGIAVATWADLGEEVAELGLAWGAAKAYLHKALHQRREPGAP